MAVPGKARKTIVTAAIFIVLELAAVAILRASNSIQSVWLNRLSLEIKAWVWGKSDAVKSYFALKNKNLYLEEENIKLSEELRKYQQLKIGTPVDNIDTDIFDYIGAQIIKLSFNHQKNYFILDKGSEDGVEANMGVISSNGIIGIIDAVSAHLSHGRTIMNPGIGLSARVGRNGLAGTMVWDGISTNKALLRGIPLYFEVSKSDTIWTSGYSELFPRGIALGIVEETTTKNGATKDVVIDLFQDIRSVNYVYIVKPKYSTELEYLKTKEN